MKSRTVFLSCLFVVSVALSAGVRPAAADLSHARIVRLSLTEGDVRFTRSAGNDPLTDANAHWETAVVNLPIQQGYVLSTGNGRAAVEFENGAAAYLDNDSMLEFYELSLSDGARITQLVLRQGSAAFYVNPARGDVFSVTGGDFTAIANDRANFRVNNYDDGSTVVVNKGRVSVQTKEKTVQVAKGQSATVRAGDAASIVIRQAAASDDFDAWVAGREESFSAATNNAQQYVSSSYYDAGLGDLYTYGSWFDYPGFGYCWRPIGAGFGWSPFTLGQWAFVPGIGWTWVSLEPWGWMPYHFGGWFFSPMYGWVWVPSGIGLGTGRYWRPVTAVWVRSGTTTGLVPVHPLDVKGKTPINLAHGVIRTPGMGGTVGLPTSADSGAKWKVLSRPPRGVVSEGLSVAAAPGHISRTVLSGSAGNRAVTVGRDSSIVYDGREHKFVNANAAPPISSEGLRKLSGDAARAMQSKDAQGQPSVTRPGTVSGPAPAGVGAPALRSMPAPPRVMTPPPAPAMRASPPPRVSGGGSSGSAGGGRWSSGGGASSGGGSGGGARVGGSSSSSSGGGASSNGSSHPSSGGGGRPH